MKILSKPLVSNGIVISGECYVVGVEINHTGAANAPVYNAAAATATQLFATLRATAESQFASVMFPLPGLKCDNVFSVLSAGNGTLYYYY